MGMPVVIQMVIDSAQEITMGKPYSQDLRDRVIGAMDGGGEAYEIAPLFQVSVSYIYKILARRRTTGEITPRSQRHGPLPKLAAYDEVIRARVEAVPDTTIDELRAWLLSEHKIRVGNTCVWKRLRRLGLTLKKSHSGLPSKIARMSRRRGNAGETTSRR
jgi:transposase